MLPWIQLSIKVVWLLFHYGKWKRGSASKQQIRPEIDYVSQSTKTRRLCMLQLLRYGVTPVHSVKKHTWLQHLELINAAPILDFSQENSPECRLVLDTAEKVNMVRECMISAGPLVQHRMASLKLCFSSCTPIVWQLWRLCVQHARVSHSTIVRKHRKFPADVGI